MIVEEGGLFSRYEEDSCTRIVSLARQATDDGGGGGGGASAARCRKGDQSRESGLHDLCCHTPTFQWRDKYT